MAVYNLIHDLIKAQMVQHLIKGPIALIWILAVNNWNDSGVWVDTDQWND